MAVGRDPESSWAHFGDFCTSHSRQTANTSLALEKTKGLQMESGRKSTAKWCKTPADSSTNREFCNRKAIFLRWHFLRVPSKSLSAMAFGLFLFVATSVAQA